MDDMKIKPIISQLAINMGIFQSRKNFAIDPATVMMIIEIIMEIIEFIQANYGSRSGGVFERPDLRSKLKMVSLFKKVRMAPTDKVVVIQIVWSTIRDLRKRKVI